MQVEVDVKCMHANFGGRSLSVFRDFAFFLFYSNFIYAYSPWGQKIESVKENIHKCYTVLLIMSLL